MAIDKSKENSRIEELLAMSEDDLKLLCSVGINNPAMLKQFMSEGAEVEDSGSGNESESEETDSAFKWEYAAAAGLIDWDDVAWIKEHINESEEEETEEPTGN